MRICLENEYLDLGHADRERSREMRKLGKEEHSMVQSASW